MKKIVILGTGGTSVDILDTIFDLKYIGKDIECVGFLDDNESNWGKKIRGIEVLGPLKKASSLNDVYFVNGIGSSKNYPLKEKVISKLNIPSKRFLSLIHPTASISKTAKLGHGVVIFQNVTVTTNVKIGNHVVILPNSIISHDCQIGNYTCITGGVCISGRVKIGKLCYIGTNSSFREDITVGNYCLVGMGSVVLNNIPAKSVIVGNPTKLLRKIHNE